MLGFNPACWKYNFFYGGLMSEVRTKGADEKFCESCGEIIKQAAEICPKCGVRQKSSKNAENNWLTVLLLCLFLGALGIHRFYVGKTGTGILQLLTLGGCGIWALIDLIMIVMQKFTDKEGNFVTRS